jgi:hypothetical protein
VDRKPVIAYPDRAPASDALVGRDLNDLAQLAEGEPLLLAEIDSPFQSHGPALNDEFRTDPMVAAAKLDEVVRERRDAIARALDQGADGIFYRLHGARARYCTPMQYGGHYLERDRELLDEIQDARLNVLFLVGNDDLYLDFVSDLPAHVIAWDRDASGFTSAEVRALRNGAQASGDPDSEILLHHPGVRIADRLDRF